MDGAKKESRRKRNGYHIQRICPEREEVARDNREYLRYLFKYILWFATNEVPMRADDALAVGYSAEKWWRGLWAFRSLTSSISTQSRNTQKKRLIVSSTPRGPMVVRLGANGANVAELLRSEQFYWLIYVHCTAHRLNPLVNDLIKGCNLALDIMSTINSLYTFLNHPKVREAYDTVQRTLPSVSIQTPGSADRHTLGLQI